MRTDLSENLNLNIKLFFKKNAVENFVCNVMAILSRPQYFEFMLCIWGAI